MVLVDADTLKTFRDRLNNIRLDITRFDDLLAVDTHFLTFKIHGHHEVDHQIITFHGSEVGLGGSILLLTLITHLCDGHSIGEYRDVLSSVDFVVLVHGCNLLSVDGHVNSVCFVVDVSIVDLGGSGVKQFFDQMSL